MSYYCKYCNYDTSDKSNYTKHLNSKKHLNNINNIEENKNAIILLKNNYSLINENRDISEKFICKNCGKEYSYNTGYYRHIKKCEKISKNLKRSNSIIDKNKENKENKENNTNPDSIKETESYKLLLTKFMDLEHKFIESENEYKNKIKQLEEENKDLLNKVFENKDKNNSV